MNTNNTTQKLSWIEKNREHIRRRHREYYARNRDRVRAQFDKWLKDNPDKAKKYRTKWQESEACKKMYKTLRSRPEHKTYMKTYRERNKEHIKQKSREYVNKPQRKEKNKKSHHERYHNDINYKLSCNLRAQLRRALTNSKTSKLATVQELLGCSIEDFKSYMAALFREGMSWSNHGEWHIDHIKPCAAFNLSDHEEQRRCFHYTNLQPLWKSENSSKRSRYEGVGYFY